MKRPSLRKQQAFQYGYAAGRTGESWSKGRVSNPWKSKAPIAFYYRGWNLGQRVTRRLEVNRAEKD